MSRSSSESDAGVSDVQWAMLQAENQRLSDALQQANKELAQARENSDTRTKQYLETFRRRGYEEGFAKGKEAGIQEERVRARQPPPPPRPSARPPPEYHYYPSEPFSFEFDFDTFREQFRPSNGSSNPHATSKPWYCDPEPPPRPPPRPSFYDADSESGVPPRPKKPQSKPQGPPPKPEPTPPKPASKPTAFEILGIHATTSKKQYVYSAIHELTTNNMMNIGSQLLIISGFSKHILIDIPSALQMQLRSNNGKRHSGGFATLTTV
ncbi:MAG: hypothetical protein M1812_005429 [Candelaria pacifica]|nr:MAG: hypothetical protein M1812_005429 [Candelaria pacifica]